MIRKGDKFKVHWKGHEECYIGRIYEVTNVIYDCTCPNPNCFVNGLPETPRKPHVHIRANMIECPHEGIERGGYSFGGIDEDTLIEIECPDCHLEIIHKKGDQLSLF